MTDEAAPSQQQHAEAPVSHTLWHMAFLAPLAARSCALSAMRSNALSGDGAPAVVAAAYSAAVMEAVGYSKAGAEVERILQRLDGNVERCTAHQTPALASNWLGVFSDCTRQHAEQLFASKADASEALTRILRATQQRYKSNAVASTSASACNALFASLAAACVSRSSPNGQSASASADAVPLSYGVSLFHIEGASAVSSTSTAHQRQLHRQWQEARLYGALTCAAAGIAAPGPLARLLAAYVHATDDRLRAAADAIFVAHLHASSAAEEGATPAEVGAVQQTEVKAGDAAAATAATQARLSGVVAGVLEYALHMARTRSSATVTALNALTSVPSTAGTASEASSSLSFCTSASQRAALLLVQFTEECGYYHQTAAATSVLRNDGATAETATAAATALAVVHAVQELLFTIVLGGGTSGMANRPEPGPAKKTAQSAAPPLPLSLLVTTRRGVSLPEADTIAQELFPAIVQQLGLEWVWSPLLRHLSSLDRQQQPAGSEKSGPALSSASPPRLGSSVRWSSQAVMDMVLLTLARKVYPQRLLNILPGSYERLLQNLDLLPPTPLQADDGSELPSAVAAAAASRATLYELPVYYAEPAALVVSYFQRAGVSGLRLEEVSRTLSNATSSYAMVVRLKAQAPPSAEVGEDDDEGEGIGTKEHARVNDLDGDSGSTTKSHTAQTYALSRERVRSLIARYQGEVLLAAVVVYTQLRIPSQTQQLMRALAPLFLQIQLDWRTHHDGSITSWFLLPADEEGNATRGVRFSSEATVLIDKVGYEFYPLEWLPAVAASLCGSSALSALPFPYSLCAAVGHQFHLHLRGTPLGGSGDATLRHPAGPRSSVVMPTSDAFSLVSDGGAGDTAAATAAAWQRTQRFLSGLLEVCYLDPRTSSTELEGTLAVSSTRRVLTTSSGAPQSSYGSTGGGGGGTTLVAAADIAAQRLRSLLQEPAVMDAMWGSMEHQQRQQRPGAARGNARDAQRGQKRTRSDSGVPPETVRAAAEEHLRAMHRLLLDYGAASFDSTVEAADFALVVAQAFLPATAGVCTASAKQGGKRSAALLQAALEWSRGVVGASANRARVTMLLQQQQQQHSGPASAPGLSTQPLAYAYNSATMDTAWLARRALRFVPCRILEKMETAQTEARALARRETQWVSRLPATDGAPAAAEEEEKEEGNAVKIDFPAAYRLNPLLVEQWTQCARLWRQLGLAEEEMEGGGEGAAGRASQPSPASADEVTCAQWLWYSPYFGEEWTVSPDV